MCPAEAKQSAAVYGFEAPDEVLSAIAAAADKQKLIQEKDVKDLHFVDLSGNRYKGLKRVLDVVISVVCSIACLIPVALVALIVYVDDPGPVVFSQYRVGKEGKRFKIYKFRTMRKDTPRYLSTAELEDPDKWITRFGRLLRKSSFDEVLQLANVIKGDMSLIGPRPLISDEYEIHEMRARFGVYQILPGITGLAQIMGRDTVTPEEKVRWDVKYLMRFSLRQDIRILLSTCFKVMLREDIVEGRKSTGEPL